MNRSSHVKPSLLGRMNERHVFQAIQRHGPASRADVTRRTGISAPTVSKAVAALIESGLLEEEEPPEVLRGRPAKQLRLACRRSQVLALVVDAERCCLAAAGLDGQVDAARVYRFDTPATYVDLLETVVEQGNILMGQPKQMATLGLGISLPGLFDYREQRGVLSPNLPITDGRTIGLDVQERLGVTCATLQESHALCLAERFYGGAVGLDDFGIVDIGAGIGSGVMAAGRLYTGSTGLAGEIGHLPVDVNGRLCGCGNRGCLETIGSITALAAEMSEVLGRTVSNDEAIALAAEDRARFAPQLARVNRYLGIGIGAFINMFNPSNVFIHSPLHSVDRRLFEEMVEQIGQHALKPTFAQCRIMLAQGTKKQGAMAGIIQHVTNALAPALVDVPLPRSMA